MLKNKRITALLLAFVMIFVTACGVDGKQQQEGEISAVVDAVATEVATADAGEEAAEVESSKDDFAKAGLSQPIGFTIGGEPITLSVSDAELAGSGDGNGRGANSDRVDSVQELLKALGNEKDSVKESFLFWLKEDLEVSKEDLQKQASLEASGEAPLRVIFVNGGLSISDEDARAELLEKGFITAEESKDIPVMRANQVANTYLGTDELHHKFVDSKEWVEVALVLFSSSQEKLVVGLKADCANIISAVKGDGGGLPRRDKEGKITPPAPEEPTPPTGGGQPEPKPEPKPEEPEEPTKPEPPPPVKPEEPEEPTKPEPPTPPVKPEEPEEPTKPEPPTPPVKPEEPEEPTKPKLEPKEDKFPVEPGTIVLPVSPTPKEEKEPLPGDSLEVKPAPAPEQTPGKGAGSNPTPSPAAPQPQDKSDKVYPTTPPPPVQNPVVGGEDEEPIDNSQINDDAIVDPDA